MNTTSPSGVEATAETRTSDRLAQAATGLDEQYAELIQLVWSCEREWAIDDRIDAAIKYGRP